MVLMVRARLQSSTLLKGGWRNENTEKHCAGDGDPADDLVRVTCRWAEDVASLQLGERRECERTDAQSGRCGRALGNTFSASDGDVRATKVHRDGGRRVRDPGGEVGERCRGVPDQSGRLALADRVAVPWLQQGAELRSGGDRGHAERGEINGLSEEQRRGYRIESPSALLSFLSRDSTHR